MLPHTTIQSVSITDIRSGTTLCTDTTIHSPIVSSTRYLAYQPNFQRNNKTSKHHRTSRRRKRAPKVE